MDPFLPVPPGGKRIGSSIAPSATASPPASTYGRSAKLGACRFLCLLRTSKYEHYFAGPINAYSRASAITAQNLTFVTSCCKPPSSIASSIAPSASASPSTSPSMMMPAVSNLLVCHHHEGTRVSHATSMPDSEAPSSSCIALQFGQDLTALQPRRGGSIQALDLLGLFGKLLVEANYIENSETLYYDFDQQLTRDVWPTDVMLRLTSKPYGPRET